MLHSVRNSIDGFVTLLKSWSPKRISEEVEPMVEVVAQILRCVVCFDQVQDIVTAAAWSPLFATLAGFLGDDASWPPPHTPQLDTTEEPDESGVEDLAIGVEHLAAAFQQVAKFSLVLLSSVEKLKIVIEQWRCNRKRRQLVWHLSGLMLQAMRFDLQTAEALVEGWMKNDKSALLDLALRIAECRNQVSEVEEPAPRYTIVFEPDLETVDKNPSFWSDFCSNDIDIANKLVAKLLKPSVDSACKMFITKCIAVTKSDLNMSVDKWGSDESGCQASPGPTKHHIPPIPRPKRVAPNGPGMRTSDLHSDGVQEDARSGVGGVWCAMPR